MKVNFSENGPILIESKGEAKLKQNCQEKSSKEPRLRYAVAVKVKTCPSVMDLIPAPTLRLLLQNWSFREKLKVDQVLGFLE